MPLLRCSKDGQRGWKWGEGGACFVGPNAREKALEQGRVVEARQSQTKSKDGEKVLVTTTFVRG